MSTVTPGDSNYSDYTARVKELEEEYQSQAKKLRKTHEEEIRARDAKHDREMERRDTEYGRAIEDIRKNTTEALSREREKQRAIVEQKNAELYDQYGRVRSNELESIQNSLRSAREDFTRQLEAQKTKNEQQREHEQKLQMERDKRHAQQLEEAAGTRAGTARKEVADAIREVQVREKERSERLTNEYDRRYQRVQMEANTQDKKTRKLAEQLDSDYHTRTKNYDEVEGMRREDLHRRIANKTEDAVRIEKDAHSREKEALSEQLRILTRFKDDYSKTRANLRAETIRETENEIRGDARVANDLYKEELENFRRAINEREDYYARMNDRTLREKDRIFNEVRSRDQEDHRRELKDAKEVFERNRVQLETRNKLDRDAHQRTMESYADASNQERERALVEQAKTYSELVKRIDQSTKSDIRRLEEELTERASSDKVALVAPAAEKKITDQVRNEYEKQFKAERERHAESVKHIQESTAGDVQEVLHKAEKDFAKAQRIGSMERYEERNELLAHIADTEATKGAILREQERANERSLGQRDRLHASSMERQRREYEEIISALKTDSSSKLAAVRQEANFNEKLNQRAFSIRQNELIREYEKRLADQRTEYTDQITQVKADADEKVREESRNAKAMIEEATRTYDQRLAQLESQFSERERMSEANHREELEKVQRANARIIRKKS